jgi:hypothetical protein
MPGGMRLWFVDKYGSLLHIVQLLFIGLATNTIV